MQKLNYSRQREAIWDYLSHTDSHPTAEDVYNHIRETFPNISLGTVYRNLTLLVSQGKAARIQGEDCDHFDSNTELHYHFICDCCNKVFDINMAPCYELNQTASGAFSGTIRGHNTVFFGTCPDCMARACSK